MPFYRFFKKLKSAREARKKKIEEYNSKKFQSKQAEKQAKDAVVKNDAPTDDEEQVPSEQAPVNVVKSVSSGYMPSDTSAEPTTKTHGAKTEGNASDEEQSSPEDTTNDENKESSTEPETSNFPEPPMSPATVFSEQVSVIEPPRNLKKQLSDDDDEANTESAQNASTGLLCGCI
jgi:hypothetical protein